MINIGRALSICIAFGLFLMLPINVALSYEAEGPEDVPKLNLKPPDITKVAENQQPTLRVTVTPLKPLIGGEPVHDSEGQKCCVVVKARGWDAEDEDQLKYKFIDTSTGQDIEGRGWDWDNDVCIPFIEELDPSIKGYVVTIEVRAMDSKGAISDPVKVNFKVLNPNYPDYNGEEETVSIVGQERRSEDSAATGSGQESSSGRKNIGEDVNFEDPLAGESPFIDPLTGFTIQIDPVTGKKTCIDPVTGETIFVENDNMTRDTIDTGTRMGGPVSATFESMDMEANVNRIGMDYTDFDLPRPDPALCKEECIKDRRCKACTYVRPGYQGSIARCWLKYEVPHPEPGECCVSWVKSSEERYADRITTGGN